MEERVEEVTGRCFGAETPAPSEDPRVSVLIMDAGEESKAELMLQEADFPEYFVDMDHPADGKEVQTAQETQYIEYRGAFGHHRLLARIWFGTKDEKYVSLTFDVETGAPYHFYLSKKAVKILQKCGRLLEDDAGREYMNILGKIAVVHPTPSSHEPGNIIGLKLIKILGLHVSSEGFSFSTEFTHL